MADEGKKERNPVLFINAGSNSNNKKSGGYGYRDLPDLSEVLIPARKLAADAAIKYAIEVLKEWGAGDVSPENIRCHSVPDKFNEYTYHFIDGRGSSVLIFTEILHIEHTDNGPGLRQELWLSPRKSIYE